jgi:hypothetical protein
VLFRRNPEISRPEAFNDRVPFAGHHLVAAGVGAIAVLIALYGPRQFVFMSPTSFGPMGPFPWLFGTAPGRRRKALVAALEGRR